MHGNVNTRDYWEQRFSSGDWEEKRGRWQTRNFALGQVPLLHMDRSFDGTLMDFGCGLGDAMPVYRERYPRARLIGVDICAAAIEICKERYGSFAHFEQGDADCVPGADVIVSSNVLEHLDDDCAIARHLMAKCGHLYVITPYREKPLSPEHIRSYDKHRFAAFAAYDCTVFPCPGWSQYGLHDLWLQVRLKNLARFALGRPVVRRNLQIMFHFVNPAWGEVTQRASAA